MSISCSRSASASSSHESSSPIATAHLGDGNDDNDDDDASTDLDNKSCSSANAVNTGLEPAAAADEAANSPSSSAESSSSDSEADPPLQLSAAAARTVPMLRSPSVSQRTLPVRPSAEPTTATTSMIAHDSPTDTDDDIETVVLASESSEPLAVLNFDAPSDAGASDADLYVALAPFAASEAGELALHPGDLLLVTARSDTGWCRATNAGNGLKGWVPHAHLRLALPDEQLRARKSLAELKTPKRRRKKRSSASDSAAAAAAAIAALPEPSPAAAPAAKGTAMSRAKNAIHRMSRSFSLYDTKPDAPPTAAPSTPPPQPSQPRRASFAVLGTLRRAMAGSKAEPADVPVSEPTFLEHRSHIGVSQEGQFEWHNVDEQWKSLFVSVKGRFTKRNGPRRRDSDLVKLNIGAASAAAAAAAASSASSTTAAAAEPTLAPPAVVFPDIASLKLAETLAEAKRLRAELAANGGDDNDDDDDYDEDL